MISVLMSSNEAGSKRAAGLALALADDPRFRWDGYENIPVDLCFSFVLSDPIHGCGKDLDNCIETRFNVELKEPADYIASALGPSGHLYSQVLTMRELGHPCMVLVLGSDEDITNAIKDATKTRYKGQERVYQIGSYNDRLLDFEANSLALGVPVMRWKASPWKRLLSCAHKILTGGSLMGYRPRPANNERQLVAASMLFKNVGPSLMRTLLNDYDLMFCPKPNARAVEDLPGFGNKRVELIKSKILCSR